MTTDRFRSVALALREYVSDTYALLNAADAIVSLDGQIQTVYPLITSPDGNAEWDYATARWVYSHDYLVNLARKSDVILSELANSRKINAIKELLRVAPKCGLKAAKDAVEDNLVAIAADLRSDPWADHREPPF